MVCCVGYLPDCSVSKRSARRLVNLRSVLPEHAMPSKTLGLVASPCEPSRVATAPCL